MPSLNTNTFDQCQTPTTSTITIRKLWVLRFSGLPTSLPFVQHYIETHRFDLNQELKEENERLLRYENRVTGKTQRAMERDAIRQQHQRSRDLIRSKYQIPSG